MLRTVAAYVVLVAISFAYAVVSAKVALEVSDYLADISTKPVSDK